MKRREFITLLGGAAAAWPLSARAQQGERMQRIGVLLPAAPDDAQYQTWVGAFLQGLAQLGWTIGRNVRIDTRWATTNAVDIRRHAAELVALAPDVILSHGDSTVGPLLQVTRTVPIVFVLVLMSYGTSLADTYRQVGIYAGRVLKGEKPADLPVVQPIRFDLVINLKTAKALGLTVSASLLARADEVIE
jgi:putative tryptophan/tyrosine transport system substrate-binding protein